MKKKALVTLISVVAILLVFSSSMSNPAAAQPETATKPLLAQVSKPAPKPAQVMDSATGRIIGYVDPKTSNLIFTTQRIMIPRSGITRVSREEYELLRQQYGLAPTGPHSSGRKSTKKLTRFPAVKLPAGSDSGGGGGGGGGGGSCTSSCWYFREGGAMCQGCCIDVGGGNCSCWEYCSDVASSGQGK